MATNPLLRQAETARLLAEAAAPPEPRRAALVNEVVVLNMGVAAAVARRYRNRSVPLEDLEQVANMALLRAAQKFDVRQQHDFLSFAVPTMSGEIKRYFRDHGWTVRPPRRIQELQARVIDARHEIGDDGRAPSVAAIAAHLGVATAHVSEALQADGCFRPSSLDAPVAAGSLRSLGDSLAFDDEDERHRCEARQLVTPDVRRLAERDRRIVHLRFVEGRTQQQIGAEVGLTQVQVSRILRRILEGLREQLVDQ